MFDQEVTKTIDTGAVFKGHLKTRDLFNAFLFTFNTMKSNLVRGAFVSDVGKCWFW